MRKPKRLPLDEIYNCLPEETQRNNNVLCFRNGIGVVIGVRSFFFHHIETISSPYILDDYRMGMVVRGTLKAVVNLRECVMRAGTVVFITPGTIVEPLEVSDDFYMVGMGLPADKFMIAHKGKLPEYFNWQNRDGRLVVSAEEQAMVTRMFVMLRDLMAVESTDDEVVYSMVSAISNYYGQLFREGRAASEPSHTIDIFNRFLRLVNLNCRKEHQLPFYAGKLCITSRYLGSVVMATSGVKAKDWIDRAIVSTAKVMLKHSDMQTAQIAYELNFTNVSFFCKYFKRITGMTPQQYRRF